MKVLITCVELIEKEEKCKDEKGWSFKKAFEKLGMKTETFFYRKKGRMEFIEKDKNLKKIWRWYMNKKFYQLVKKSKPDILLINKGETIEAETLWEIRKKTDTIIINVFPDNPIYMGKVEAIKPCHLFFVKDTYILQTLRKAGLKNVFYLPQCTDPEVYRPLSLNHSESTLYSTDISLLGSMYPYRVEFIKELIPEFKPAIWGKGWSKISNNEILNLYRGKDIRGTPKAKAISGTAISLNPHHPLNDINGVNKRTYDIAACKGFQLADFKPDMETVFEVGKEIICYKTMDELKKYIRYYLQHPNERNEIAGIAYRRLIKEHTYDIRTKQILEFINNKIT
jgi:spore maturation protein CgeB